MTEEVIRLAILIGSAFLAGILNSVAGGGTLLTFPALLSFGILPGGMPGIQANATSTVALVPGSLAGAWGFRRHLGDAGPWLLLLLIPSVVGGAIGTLLVTRLDPRTFSVLVPWLLLTATVLFLLQPLFRRFIPLRDSGLPSWPIRCALVLFQLLVAIYGGYFGAGIGILMLSSLGLMGIGNIHRMNAVKTILAAAINFVSVVIFAIDDKVVWSVGLIMMVGAIAGGYAGASVGQRLPREVVRWIVIVLGVGLTVWYFLRPVSGESEHPTPSREVIMIPSPMARWYDLGQDGRSISPPQAKEDSMTQRIYHSKLSTPIGELFLTSNGMALTGVYLQDYEASPQLDTTWEEGDEILREAREQLTSYFAGTRTVFDLPLAPAGTPFQLSVWEKLNDIPFGTTISYGEQARRLNCPRASRAVGSANGRNPISIVVPCHRVIGANGQLTGYGGGLDCKRWLLEHEATIVDSRRQLSLLQQVG